MPWPKGTIGPRKGAILEQVQKEKIRTSLNKYYTTHMGARKGQKHSQATKKKLSEIAKVTSIGNTHLRDAWSRILAEVPLLEARGFKVFPITSAIPDIVAVKDNKLYVIEVEYTNPNYAKYTPEIKKYADEVIWILRGKLKR